MSNLQSPDPALTAIHSANASSESARTTGYGSRPIDRDLRAILAVERKRTKTDRRKQIDPTTCDRDYSEDELEFMRALDDYKRRNGRMFPTCSEILEVLRSLGYAKASRADAFSNDAAPSHPIDSATDALAMVDELASNIDRLLHAPWM